jgi:uncharacterized tellurite resistance protein B-like protein
MLKSFLTLFTQQAEQQPDSSDTIELATAALLYEVVHADSSVDEAEEKRVEALLRSHFKIESTALDALIQSGRESAKDAVDLVQFTRVLNTHYTIEQRTEVLRKMWLVAFADNELDMHEEHIIRKIADLLHIPHSLFIQSKLNAKASS